MGQAEGPARPEDKRTIKFLLGRFGGPELEGSPWASQRGSQKRANFYWADLGFLDYKGAHGPARGASQTRRQKNHQISTGQIWGSLIMREPMGQPEGPARPEDKRTIKFLLGRFGVPQL